MQEEVDQKVISLCVTGMRMSKDVLKVAMRKWLSAKEQKKQEKRQIKVDKLGVMFLHLELLFYHWYPSLYLTDLLGGFAGAAIFLVYFRYRKLNAKKFRKGEEYGSARWGNEKDIAP